MKTGMKLFVVLALIFIAGIAFFVSPSADPNPDGLNRVAIDKGFAAREKQHGLARSPLAGYAVKGVRNERMSTGLSGLMGVSVTFLLAAGFFVLIRHRVAHDRHGSNEEPA